MSGIHRCIVAVELRAGAHPASGGLNRSDVGIYVRTDGGDQMKIIGGLLIAFGLVDVIGSFAGLDVWGEWIGVNLPEAIWSFTAYIEMGLGYFLISLGSKAADDGGSPVAE